MRISEQRIKFLIKDSIKKNMIREGVAWKGDSIGEFEFRKCDLSKFDPTFMKVFNLFQDESSYEKRNYENKSFVKNLANALGSDPDFISPSLITTLNTLLIPGLEMIASPLGASGFVVCDFLSEISQKFSYTFQQAYRGYNPDDLENKPNKDKNDIFQKRQYFLNGLIKQSEFKTIIPSGRTKLFPYTVVNLANKLDERNVNGFDAIFFPMFISNTLSNVTGTSGLKSTNIDVHEVIQLKDFANAFRNSVTYARDHSDVLSIFENRFDTLVTSIDTAMPGLSPTAKVQRMNVFIEYLKGNMTYVKEIFEKPNDLSNDIIKELNRMIQFTK